jgi:hypothetical protein
VKLPRRGPREVYRFYGEDEAPDVDEWSAASEPAPESGGFEPAPEPEAPTRELGTWPAPEPGDAPTPVRGRARAGQWRRVAVMTLLGAGVGLVVALAIHSLCAPAGVERRGEEGAASLPAHSLSASAAPVSPQVPAQRTTPAWAAGRSRVKRGRAPRARYAVLVASSSVVVPTAAAVSAGADEAPAQAQPSEFSFER